MGVCMTVSGIHQQSTSNTNASSVCPGPVWHQVPLSLGTAMAMLMLACVFCSQPQNARLLLMSFCWCQCLLREQCGLYYLWHFLHCMPCPAALYILVPYCFEPPPKCPAFKTRFLGSVLLCDASLLLCVMDVVKHIMHATVGICQCTSLLTATGHACNAFMQITLYCLLLSGCHALIRTDTCSACIDLWNWDASNSALIRLRRRADGIDAGACMVICMCVCMYAQGLHIALNCNSIHEPCDSLVVAPVILWAAALSHTALFKRILPLLMPVLL